MIEVLGLLDLEDAKKSWLSAERAQPAIDLLESAKTKRELGGGPLVGPNMDSFGPRFPDMSRPYDSGMIHTAEKIAQEEKITFHKGVYAAMVGPNLETRAEYRFIKTIGADVVGMSTVPEVIVANHMGIRVLAISVVTDECDPDNLMPVNIEEIIAIAGLAEPSLTRIFSRMIREA